MRLQIWLRYGFFPLGILFASLASLLAQNLAPATNRVARGILGWEASPPPTQTSAPPAAIRSIGSRSFLPTPTVASPSAAQPMDPMMAAMIQQAGLDQNVTVTAEFDPPSAALGQRITYRVTVTAMVEGVSAPDKPPTPQGLELVLAGRGFNYGPFGAMVQPRTTFNYRASVSGPGTYVMPPYNVTANGKSVKVPEARLTVLPAGTGTAREPLRLRVELPPGDFYIGQAIPARLVVADPGDNTLQAVSQPQVNGEAIMSEAALLRQGRELRNVGGRNSFVYATGIQIIPVKAGRLEFIAQAYAHQMRHAPNAGFLGATLDSVLVNSDPVSIEVKHLPKQGELPGFTGAIGTFQVEPPRLSSSEVRAGEPLTLTVAIKGEGNLTRLIPPRLDRLRDWQSFPPLADPSGALQTQVRGSAAFTYTLIPLSERVKATPAIPFCYFDPTRKSYVDATIPPAPVKVTASPNGPALGAEVATVVAPGMDDPDRSGSDREPVMACLAEIPGRVSSTLTPLQSRPWFLLAQAGPAAMLGGLWLWDRRRRHLESHPEVALRANARRRLRRHLRALRRAGAERDAAAFVAAGVGALRDVGAPFEAANPQALVCADILRLFPEAERNGEEGRLVSALFAAADAQRFAGPAPGGGLLLARQRELEVLLEKWRARL